MSSTAAYAFADALLALDELGHHDVSERLAQRWADVPIPTAAEADTHKRGRFFGGVHTS